MPAPNANASHDVTVVFAPLASNLHVEVTQSSNQSRFCLLSTPLPPRLSHEAVGRVIVLVFRRLGLILFPCFSESSLALNIVCLFLARAFCVCHEGET